MDGAGGTDLYALRPNGGAAIGLTFTPVAESAPALSPDGGAVAFLRTPWREGSPGAARSIWVMNLLSGAERELALPDGAGTPLRAGWAPDASAVYIETDRGVWRVALPPGRAAPVRVSGADRARGDSALMVLLGQPAFARAVPCDTLPGALCSVAADGGSSVLTAGAEHPARWGSDSAAYVRNGTIEVRPLGPGRPRRIELPSLPGPIIGLTFFPGS